MICLFCILTTLAFVAEPARAPTTLAEALAAVESPEPADREAGRRVLLERSVGRVDRLAAAARAAAPLSPGQRSAVRLAARQAFARQALLEVLRQVGEAGPPLPGLDDGFPGVGGFLGITLMRLGQDDEAGALIVSTVPGNVAATFLRPGDRVVALEGDVRLPVRRQQDLSGLIASTPPGTTLRFEIVRGGVTLSERVALDRRVPNFGNVVGNADMMIRGEAVEEADAWYGRTIRPLEREPQVIRL